MRFAKSKLILKNGGECILRSPDPEDAEALIEYMKKTSGETPFLLRTPEEIEFTTEGEREFLEAKLQAEREMLLIAEVDGRLAGNCALNPVGIRSRVLHRCSFAIALYRDYWGMGIGTLLFTALINEAIRCGYEQAELEVVCGNDRALALYEKMGFEIWGRRPRAMKYADGSFADELLMVKDLRGGCS